MKWSKRKSAPRASIENIESRLHLDGNVNAAIQDGDLVIRGDEEDNQIVIMRLGSGATRIEGREDTKINGRDVLKLARVSGDLVIDFDQDGEDLAAVQGPFDVPGDLTAQIGEGELLLEGSLGAIDIGGDLEAEAGEEAVVNVRNEVNVAGEMSISSEGEAFIAGGWATVPDFADARFTNSLQIDNPYFPLITGARYEYDVAGIDDDTDEPFTEHIIVEVTDQTKTILGVSTRVVRDRVLAEGLLIEDTFDWYAQDDNGNVWYFGEDTTDFEYDDDGNVIGTDTEGSWIAGVDSAQAGTIMEAQPRVGHRYYQEFAPGDVLDAAQGVSLFGRVRVPVGFYRNVYRSEEVTVTEPEALANKLYAPGVGTIIEFDYDLEDHEVIQTTRLVSLTLNGRAVSTVVNPGGFSGVNPSGRFVGGATVEGDEASIESADVVVVNGAMFAGELEVSSEAETYVVSSDLFGNAAFAAEAVTFRDVFADGSVRVGGGSDVQIFDSNIRRLNTRFGGANNDLRITNSLFDVVDARGGGGENILVDRGGNSFGILRLRQFEVI